MFRDDPVVGKSAVGVLSVEPSADCLPCIGCKRKEAFAVHGIRDFRPGDIKESRHDIAQLGNAVAALTALYSDACAAACPEEQGDPAAPLIGAGFAEHMVVAQLFPVVRGKEDHSIFVNLMFDQPHDETTDLMVKMGDARVIADLCLSHKLRISRPGFGVKDPSVSF